MITTAMMKSDVQEKYSDLSEQKLAELTYTAGLDWISRQPVEWNGAKTKNRLEARRERRRKREELHNHLTNHMADVNPSQFVIPSFIFSYILSAIISWVVKKILAHYWPDE